jgi:hypothetical protein
MWYRADGTEWATFGVMFGSQLYFSMHNLFTYYAKHFVYNRWYGRIADDLEKFEQESLRNTEIFIINYYNNPSVKLDEEDLINLMDIYTGMLFHKHNDEMLFTIVEECYKRAFNSKYENCGEIQCEIPYEFVNKPQDNPDDEIWCYVQYNELVTSCVHCYGTIAHQKAIYKMKKFFETYSKSSIVKNVELSHNIMEFYKNYQKLCYINFYEKYDGRKTFWYYEVFTIIQYLKHLPKEDISREALNHMKAIYNKKPKPGNFPRKKYIHCKKTVINPPKSEIAYDDSLSFKCYKDFTEFAEPIYIKTYDGYPDNLDYGSELYQEFCRLFEEVYKKYEPHIGGDRCSPDLWGDRIYTHYSQTVGGYTVQYKGFYEEFKIYSYANLVHLIEQYLALPQGKKLRYDDDVEYLGIIKNYVPKDDELYPFIDEAYKRITIKGYERVDLGPIRSQKYCEYLHLEMSHEPDSCDEDY